MFLIYTMCHLILNEVNISRQCMHSEGGSIWAWELLRRQIIFVHNLLTQKKTSERRSVCNHLIRTCNYDSTASSWLCFMNILFLKFFWVDLIYIMTYHNYYYTISYRNTFLITPLLKSINRLTLDLSSIQSGALNCLYYFC